MGHRQRPHTRYWIPMSYVLLSDFADFSLDIYIFFPVTASSFCERIPAEQILGKDIGQDLSVCSFVEFFSGCMEKWKSKAFLQH